MFINSMRGNILTRYMHLQMAEGTEYTWLSDYTAVQVPILSAESATEEEPVTAAKANQSLLLISAATVTPVKGYKCLVTPNPELHKYASVPSLLLYSVGDSGRVELPARFHKACDLTRIEWLVRLHLVE